jgi:hypothetical protein
LVVVDFFLLLAVLELELSVVFCAATWATGEASAAHKSGASQAWRDEKNDKKPIPIALEDIKTM